MKIFEKSELVRKATSIVLVVVMLSAFVVTAAVTILAQFVNVRLEGGSASALPVTDDAYAVIVIGGDLSDATYQACDETELAHYEETEISPMYYDACEEPVYITGGYEWTGYENNRLHFNGGNFIVSESVEPVLKLAVRNSDASNYKFEYFKLDTTETFDPLTADDVLGERGADIAWTEVGFGEDIPVESGEAFILYAKVTDKATGGVLLTSSCVIMRDVASPVINDVKVADPEGEGASSGKFEFTVETEDNEAGASSGIESISWWVESAGEAVTEEHAIEDGGNVVVVDPASDVPAEAREHRLYFCVRVRDFAGNEAIKKVAISLEPLTVSVSAFFADETDGEGGAVPYDGTLTDKAVVFRAAVENAIAGDEVQYQFVKEGGELSDDAWTSIPSTEPVVTAAELDYPGEEGRNFNGKVYFRCGNETEKFFSDVVSLPLVFDGTDPEISIAEEGGAEYSEKTAGFVAAGEGYVKNFVLTATDAAEEYESGIAESGAAYAVVYFQEGQLITVEDDVTEAFVASHGAEWKALPEDGKITVSPADTDAAFKIYLKASDKVNGPVFASTPTYVFKDAFTLTYQNADGVVLPANVWTNEKAYVVIGKVVENAENSFDKTDVICTDGGNDVAVNESEELGVYVDVDFNDHDAKFEFTVRDIYNGEPVKSSLNIVRLDDTDPEFEISAKTGDDWYNAADAANSENIVIEGLGDTEKGEDGVKYSGIRSVRYSVSALDHEGNSVFFTKGEDGKFVPKTTDVENADYFDYPIDEISEKFGLLPVAALPDGEITVTVIAEDNACGITTKSFEESVTFKKDTKLPEFFGAPYNETFELGAWSNNPDAAFSVHNINDFNGNATAYDEEEGETVFEAAASGVASLSYKFGEDGDETVIEASSLTDAEEGMRYLIDSTTLPDGDYTLYVTVTDEAGNSVTVPYSVMLDRKAPELTIKLDERGEWTVAGRTILLKERYNAGSAPEFKLESGDAKRGDNVGDSSGVARVDYAVLHYEDFKNVTDPASLPESVWGEYKDVIKDVKDNLSFILFARAADAAENVTYARTDGVIFDIAKPEVPVIRITTVAPARDVYNGSVQLSINVTDPIIGQSFARSGLDEVTYLIDDGVGNTEAGTLYRYAGNRTAKDGMLDTNGQPENRFSTTITVNSAKFNANNIKVTVMAKDLAGYENKADITLNIDVTSPKIDVYYDNNAADLSYPENAYFNADRTATVVVTERNFDPALVSVNVTRNGAAIPVFASFEMISDGAGNHDDRQYRATIPYNADGDYTFSIAATDTAMNAANQIDYTGAGRNVAPEKFCIDKTNPVVTLTFDANSLAGKNDNYKEGRVLTITVTEHNFDEARFVPSDTAEGMSGWTHNGDTHTATISFNPAEGTERDYDFSYTLKDKAGNEAAPAEHQIFTVDRLIPEIRIVDNVKNTKTDERGAYNGDVNFSIFYKDTNIDPQNVTVDLKTTRGEDYSDKLSEAFAGQTNGEYEVVFQDPASVAAIPDGIYVMTVTVSDLAGNTNSVEKTFSVNRNSSNYEFSEALQKAIHDVYNRELSGDVTVSEINCDLITARRITLVTSTDTKVLTEGADYTVTQGTFSGSGGWIQYDYKFNDSLFDGDGKYTIVIETTDAAGNTSRNDSEERGSNAIEFYMDRTKPVISFTGIGTAPVNAKTVQTLIMYEENVCIDRIVVKIERPGKDTIEKTYSPDDGIDFMTGEIMELLEEADGRQTITITAYDRAGNESDKIEQTFTISTNAWVRFINDPLSVGLASGGLAALVAAGIIIPVAVKKKKSKKEAK